MLVHRFSVWWSRLGAVAPFREVGVHAEAGPVRKLECKLGSRVWAITFKGLSSVTYFLPPPAGSHLLKPPQLL